jgi:NitT/TauT family transport system permease protein
MRSERIKAVVTPLVVAVLLLLVWQFFVEWRDIKPYLLPKPSAIWDEIADNASEIWKASRVTGTNAVVGILAGTVLGVAAAMVASRFRVAGELLTPLAAAVNAIPIIVLAPIFNNIFSSTSAIPRRLIVAIVVFFPIFVNTLRGLVLVDGTKTELMRSYGASPSVIMRKVRVPNALPFFFTGLKLAASLGVIAAVVAEYFGGLQNGVGSRITSYAGATNYPRAWAYVAAACAIGLAFYCLALALERLVMPWHRARAVRS